MISSIFCCSSNKIEDEKATTDLRNANSTVFVFASTNVICRALLGELIQALEKKGLFPVKIEFKTADPAKFEKSALFKSAQKTGKFTPLGVFMLWKGENAFARVHEVVHRIGNQNTIPKVDILFTQSFSDTRREVDLWFEKDVEAKQNGEVSVAVDPPPAEPAANGEEAAETTPEGGNLVVPSVEVPPDEPVPGYEDAITEEVQDAHPQPSSAENGENHKENN